MVGTAVVGKHVYVWQGFYNYGPGWSPIRELVAAALLTLNQIARLMSATAPRRATI